jgi:hypothetical protein
MGCGTEAETNTSHRGAAIKLEKSLAQYELIVKPCFPFADASSVLGTSRQRSPSPCVGSPTQLHLSLCVHRPGRRIEGGP